MNKWIRLTLLAGALVMISACSTWNNMDRQEKGLAVGAGIGAVTGAYASEGAVLGTVGGAAIGGLIGDVIGKE